MEFSRLGGREASPFVSIKFLAGDSVVGTAFFNDDFLCFRFAAWESKGTSSVCSGSELDDESVGGSLLRFNFETSCELTDDISTLASGRHRHEQSSNSVRLGPRKYNLRDVRVYPNSNPTRLSTRLLRHRRVAVLSVIQLPWPLLLEARAMSGQPRDALLRPCAESA